MDRKQIILQNDVQQVPLLAQFVDEVCERLREGDGTSGMTAGLDMATTMKLNLAVEEAVVNVMNYAYPQGTVGDINIEAKGDDNQLEFIISDSGTPFDPTAKADANTSLTAEERPIGGLGIHLVRQIMDEVMYERKDNKNILTLRKKLH